MKKQKYMWVTVMVVFILSFSYFLYQRYVPEKSNISSESTSASMKKLESKYNTKDLIVVFKDGVSEKKINEIIKEFQGKVIDRIPEIKNYHIRITKDLTTQEMLYLVDELNSLKEVSLAVMEEKNDSGKASDSYFNNNQIESNKLFDNALATYNNPANVYYAPNGSHTFLYPSEWDITTQGKLVDDKTNKVFTYVMKKSAVDLYEEAIQNYIVAEEKSGLSLDSEMDVTQQSDLITAKWIMKKGNNLVPRALIQGKDNYYYFTPNEKVSLDEFSLIVDSFIVNKDPLKKK
ncbi:S8 family serine peptidase [Priestia aryabhattai]